MMKILIAEDDYVSRIFLEKVLSEYGQCDLTINGMEAIEVFIMALEEKNYYDLVCLDIMMPEVDGIKALKMIRKLEKQHDVSDENRTKIIMTTAIDSTKEVYDSFEAGSEGYAVKPINTEKLKKVMKKLGLIW